ncbi:MAG: NAD(P)/FAD-dependent oxidoreductase [Deltaproteobacteria bacterium]|nr:NAD(P)/FAD-dependent oxidoreductase [Deltaproteobacteria bacterium]
MERVAVIGAGVSGLTTAYWLKRRGIDFTLFEASNRVGGVWHQKAYNELFLITSRKSTYLSGSKPPEDYPDFPSAAQWLAYLEDYAASQGLEEHLRLHTAVDVVQPSGEGFEVTAAGTSESFTHVVVCSGLNQIPKHPDTPGSFSGEVLHSADYKHHRQLVGKRVLVVGEGNSGADIAVEAGRVGKMSAIAVRNSAWIIPKYAMGVPVTELQRPGTPLWAQRLFLKFIIGTSSGSPDKFGLPLPNHRLFERTMVASQQLPYMLRHGLIHPRADVARLDGSTVHFTDGRSDDFDLIVNATGYRYELSLLRGTGLDPGRVRLFRRLFVEGHHRLFVNGFYVNNGAFTQVANSAAQLIAACVAHPERYRASIEADMRRSPQAFSDEFVIPNRNAHTKALAKLHLQVSGAALAD